MKNCYALLIVTLCAATTIGARINIYKKEVVPHRQPKYSTMPIGQRPVIKVAPHRRPKYTTMPVGEKGELVPQEVAPHRR